MSLRSIMEEVFTNTEARVVAAYKVDCMNKELVLKAAHRGTPCCDLLIVLQVVKCQPSATSTFSSKKKPPKVGAATPCTWICLWLQWRPTQSTSAE